MARQTHCGAKKRKSEKSDTTLRGKRVEWVQNFCTICLARYLERKIRVQTNIKK